MGSCGMSASAAGIKGRIDCIRLVFFSGGERKGGA